MRPGGWGGKLKLVIKTFLAPPLRYMSTSLDDSPPIHLNDGHSYALDAILSWKSRAVSIPISPSG